MTRVVVVLLVVVLGPTGLARPAEAPVDQESWGRLLGAYFRNPPRVRSALVRAARAGVATLPTPVVLAVADAEMRRERYESARELCAVVRARQPDEPWSGWATLADAWAAIQLGYQDEAAAALRPLSDGGGPSSMVAAFLLALLDGSRGAFDAAQTGFERVHGSGASDELRIAALLGLGLARYWAGDFERAGGAFRFLDAEHAASPLADDARYGSALSELGLGHREEAIRLLRDVAKADHEAPPVRRIPELVDLAPHAVMQAAFDRYRRSHAREPEAQVAAALDGDAGSLARTMLARLAADDRAAALDVAERRSADADEREPAAAPDRSIDPIRPPSGAVDEPYAPGVDGSGLLWLAAVAAFLLGAGATFWRRAPRSPAARRRAR